MQDRKIKKISKCHGTFKDILIEDILIDSNFL